MLSIGLANAATNNAILTNGAATVVLNPDHAAVHHGAGLTREDIQAEIVERCTIDAKEIEKLSPGFAGWSEAGEKRNAFSSPDQVLIMMAGGSGLYSMVMPSWCAGAHKNSASSVVVESDFFCEVPGLAAQANTTSCLLYTSDAADE